MEKSIKGSIENFSNFEAILNSIDEIIGIIDTDYNMIFENTKAMEIYGKNIGERCYKAYAKRENTCPNCPTVEVFKTKKSAVSEQISYDQAGFEQIVEVVSTPLKNKSGEVVASLEVVRDVTAKRKAEKEKEKLIAKLEEALAEIKTLTGIIPICSYCKEIRDDKGSWNKLENYICEHTEAQFSHGICEKCVKKHFSGLLDENGKF